MTGLDNDFERTLAEASLDVAERKLVGERDNAVYQAIQRVHERLRAYGREFDYNVEPAIESLTQPDVTRSGNTLEISFGWDSEQMLRWEFGTSDHTIDGDPVLVFEFDESEYPYLAEMFPDGTAFLPSVEVSGIEESRVIRDVVNWFRSGGPTR